MSRRKKKISRLGWVFLSILFTYGVLLHVFLNFGLLRLINRNPEKTELNFSWIWCPWPGRAYVHGFRLFNRTDNTSWKVSLESATLDFSPETLLNRKLHILLVQGEGLRAEVQALGQEEFSAPELAEGEKDEESDANQPSVGKPKSKRPWLIQIDWIDIQQLREIQLNELQLQTQGELQASLEVLPKERIDILFHGLALKKSMAKTATVDVARELRGQLHGRLGPFHPNPENPRAALDSLRVEGTLTAKVTGLEFLQPFLKKAPWLELSGGEGELTADLAIKKGSFSPGTRLDFTLDSASEPLLLHVNDYRAEGNGSVECQVLEEKEPRGQCDVTFERFVVVRDGYSKPHIQGKELSLELVTTHLDLPKPFDAVQGSLSLPTLHVPDMGFYDAYLPQKIGLQLQDGEGDMEIQARIGPEGELEDAHVEMRARGLELTLNEARIRGSLDVSLQMQSPSISKGPFDISGSSLLVHHANLEHPDLSQEDKVHTGWWGGFAFSNAVLAPRTKTLFQADVKTELRDSAPLVFLASSKQELPGILKKVLSKKDVKGQAKVVVGDSLVDISELEIQAKSLSLLARFRLLPEGRLGLLYAKYLLLTACLVIEGENVDIKPLKNRSWYESQPPFPPLAES